MSLNARDWVNLGLTGVGLLKGNKSSRKGSNQLSNAGASIPSGGNFGVNTPNGGGFGSWGSNGGSFDLSGWSSPFQDDIKQIMEQYQALLPQAQGIFGRASGFDADRARFNNLYNELGGLRGSVAPGYSQLREARLNAIEDARSRTVGNLRDSLARRRVSGSSFANDDLARTEAEFGRASSEAEAQSFLEELDANMRLISQQQSVGQSAMQALQSRIQGELGAMGVMTSALGGAGSAASAGLSADLQILAQSMGGLQNMQSQFTAMQQLMQQNAIAQAELASGEASGYGQLAGLGISGLLGLGGNNNATSVATTSSGYGGQSRVNPFTNRWTMADGLGVG